MPIIACCWILWGMDVQTVNSLSFFRLLISSLWTMFLLFLHLLFLFLYLITFLANLPALLFSSSSPTSFDDLGLCLLPYTGKFEVPFSLFATLLLLSFVFYCNVSFMPTHSWFTIEFIFNLIFAAVVPLNVLLKCSILPYLPKLPWSIFFSIWHLQSEIIAHSIPCSLYVFFWWTYAFLV